MRVRVYGRLWKTRRRKGLEMASLVAAVAFEFAHVRLTKCYIITRRYIQRRGRVVITRNTHYYSNDIIIEWIVVCKIAAIYCARVTRMTE